MVENENNKWELSIMMDDYSFGIKYNVIASGSREYCIDEFVSYGIGNPSDLLKMKLSYYNGEVWCNVLLGVSVVSVLADNLKSLIKES